jgi:hypothetical protein
MAACGGARGEAREAGGLDQPIGRRSDVVAQIKGFEPDQVLLRRYSRGISAWYKEWRCLNKQAWNAGHLKGMSSTRAAPPRTPRKAHALRATSPLARGLRGPHPHRTPKHRAPRAPA